jgi:hypothetical protein
LEIANSKVNITKMLADEVDLPEFSLPEWEVLIAEAQLKKKLFKVNDFAIHSNNIDNK